MIGLTWQDLIIGIGQLCFFVAQIGMIRRRARVPLFSAGLTAFWLFAFVPAFISWGAWLSAASTLAGGINWSILTWSNRT